MKFLPEKIKKICPFYEELDVIFSKQPNINPPHLESSTFSEEEETASVTSGIEGSHPEDFPSRASSVEPQSKKAKNTNAQEAFVRVQSEKLEFLKKSSEMKFALIKEKNDKKYEIERENLKRREEENRCRELEIVYKRELLRFQAAEKKMSVDWEDM